MCNQTVSLVQAAIERAGIPTVSVSLLRDIAETLKPPRALWVPFPMGFPLGSPNDAALQHRVIAAALSLLSHSELPVLADYQL